MKVSYDKRTDTLTIVLREAEVVDSDEDKPGVVLDYAADGGLVALELFDASQRVTDASRVDFEETPG